MTDLRTAAQQALEALESVEWYGAGSGWMVDADAIEKSITALRAALEEPVQEPVAVEEAVRIRIMREAYDYADEGWVEAYNGVKVMCSDVIAILQSHGIGGNDE